MRFAFLIRASKRAVNISGIRCYKKLVSHTLSSSQASLKNLLLKRDSDPGRRLRDVSLTWSYLLKKSCLQWRNQIFWFKTASMVFQIFLVIFRFAWVRIRTQYLHVPVFLLIWNPYHSATTPLNFTVRCWDFITSSGPENLMLAFNWHPWYNIITSMLELLVLKRARRKQEAWAR